MAFIRAQLASCIVQSSMYVFDVQNHLCIAKIYCMKKRNKKIVNNWPCVVCVIRATECRVRLAARSHEKSIYARTVMFFVLRISHTHTHFGYKIVTKK